MDNTLNQNTYISLISSKWDNQARQCQKSGWNYKDSGYDTGFCK